MTEIGELFSLATGHDGPDDECPFCPPEKPQDFKTYPGKDNDSKILAQVMASPASLPSKLKWGPSQRR